MGQALGLAAAGSLARLARFVNGIIMLCCGIFLYKQKKFRRRRFVRFVDAVWFPSCVDFFLEWVGRRLDRLIDSEGRPESLEDRRLLRRWGADARVARANRWLLGAELGVHRGSGIGREVGFDAAQEW